MKHSWSEIPKDLPGRYFVPLGSHIWRMYKEMGFEKIKEMTQDVSTDILYDTFKLRLDESIQCSKDVIDGVLKTDSEKTMTYMFFPTITTTRVDLQQGSMKLMYGDSVDAAYVCINDYTQEILYVLNTHSENGFPLDWFLLGPEDEVLERRHRKYGIKIKDLPKKTKNIVECGQRIMDVLKDIRNERAPQWSSSLYLIAMQFGSSTIELVLEQSNYESFGTLWAGLNAKRIFGFPDYWFIYVPMPSFINMFAMLERPDFIQKLVGLTTATKFYVQHLEESARIKGRNEYPELIELGVDKTWNEVGLPLPAATLAVKYPNLKKKETWDQEKFDWNYPEEARFFKPEDVNMTIDEVCEGILFNVNHETPMDKKLSRDDMISTGIGRKTKY
ncbi:MAG: hypothetical protein ACTSVY_14485 [Candidatus Helarchaeota archaeon]